MRLLRKIWRILYWRFVGCVDDAANFFVAIKLKYFRHYLNLKTDYTISITTFDQRYDLYFKKLLTDVLTYLPDNQIIVSVNASLNQDPDYLPRLYQDWSNHHNVKFIINKEIQPLSVLWNQLIDSAENEFVLILNDDLTLKPQFAIDFNKSSFRNNSVTLINSSWSHFVIRKSVINTVGHFDEKFPGFGCEDTDYRMRLHYANIPLSKCQIASICHVFDHSESASYAHLGEKVYSKYSGVNYDYFVTKWLLDDNVGDVYLEHLEKYCTKCADVSLEYKYRKVEIIRDGSNFWIAV